MRQPLAAVSENITSLQNKFQTIKMSTQSQLKIRDRTALPINIIVRLLKSQPSFTNARCLPGKYHLQFPRWNSDSTLSMPSRYPSLKWKKRTVVWITHMCLSRHYCMSPQIILSYIQLQSCSIFNTVQWTLLTYPFASNYEVKLIFMINVWCLQCSIASRQQVISQSSLFIISKKSFDVIKQLSCFK